MAMMSHGCLCKISYEYICFVVCLGCLILGVGTSASPLDSFSAFILRGAAFNLLAWSLSQNVHFQSL